MICTQNFFFFSFIPGRHLLPFMGLSHIYLRLSLPAEFLKHAKGRFYLQVQCIAVIFLQTSWENDVLDSTNKKFTIAYSIQDLIFMQRLHNSARPNTVYLSLRYQKNVVLTFPFRTPCCPVSVMV